MEDAVLTSRVEALRNNLDLVADNLKSQAWQSEQSRLDARAELVVESSLWTDLETTLVREIRTHLAALKRVEESLAAAADQAAVQSAWVQYAKTLRDSQDLLRECLEIIGTLAIRTKDLDQKILYVADELIRECLTLSMGELHYYLLVHSLRETFSKTRARIIRLRFPEWTIWDLPLAAHELGLVAITEILAREARFDDEALRTLSPFLTNQQGALVATDPDLNTEHQRGGEHVDQVERWALSRVRVLVADAFATYTMGPAYACSAIMLRLTPSAVPPPELPSDGHRGYVILSMLRWMNARASLPRPYTDVIDKLEREWEATLDRSSPGRKLRAEDRAYLDQLTEVFGRDVSDLTLNRTAMYPQRGPSDGWSKAQEWAGAWLDQWNTKRQLQDPADATGRLRDVLNAAWLCRLGIDGPPEMKALAHRELARVGQVLCRKLIPARAGGSQVGAGASPSAGV